MDGYIQLMISSGLLINVKPTIQANTTDSSCSVGHCPFLIAIHISNLQHTVAGLPNIISHST